MADLWTFNSVPLASKRFIQYIMRFTKWINFHEVKVGFTKIRCGSLSEFEFTKWNQFSLSETSFHQVKVEFTMWKSSSPFEIDFTKWKLVHQVIFHQVIFTKVTVPLHNSKIGPLLYRFQYKYFSRETHLPPRYFIS